MRNLSLHLHLKKKEISTYQICDHWISRDGKITVGNSPSGDVHIQNTLQVFQVLLPEMIKFSSSWRHGKKVLKGPREENFTLAIGKLLWNLDLVSFNAYSCNVLKCAE